ncbi:hypothetical protein, partial [Burkholderia ubonensis]|uniref:hypothetical protein n=1 Tax=Burkholderia ubonensis TaxID=101571 RepID=UPI001E53EBE0
HSRAWFPRGGTGYVSRSETADLKIQGAPFGRAKQATRDAAMRAISGIPLEWVFNLGLPRERPLAALCSL